MSAVAALVPARAVELTRTVQHDRPLGARRSFRLCGLGEDTSVETCMALLSYTVDAEHLPRAGEAAGFQDTIVLAQ